jgi:hypothetical protein
VGNTLDIWLFATVRAGADGQPRVLFKLGYRSGGEWQRCFFGTLIVRKGREIRQNLLHL